MNNYDVIAKGKYNHPRDERVVYVTDYVIFKENGVKYLLLRFFNARKETLENLHLKLVQFNSNGKKISSEHVNFGKINGGAEDFFVPENKIELREDCSDFNVEVVSAEYGRYSYSVVNGDVRVEFTDKKDEKNIGLSAIRRAMRGKNIVIRRRRFRFPTLICLFSIVLISCITLFTFFHLNEYKGQEVTFLDGDIEYTFINKDNSTKKDLAITAYRGDATVIAIPERVSGYNVVEVSANAFRGNENLREITFNNRINIGEDAFSDCTYLKRVDFSHVDTIAVNAFRNCISLTSIQSDSISFIGQEAFAECRNLKQIVLTNYESKYSDYVVIDTNAFLNCFGLNKIEIWKDLRYNGQASIFNNCENVTSIKLNNLGELGGVTPEIFDLFNIDVDKSHIKLEEIVLNECSSIGYGMCSGLANLRSFKVNNYESSLIEPYAFADCSSLSTVYFGSKITYIGEYAFYNSAIEYFDGSFLVGLGQSSFKDCKSLKRFDLKKNSSLNEIPASAFSGCASLSSIIIPSSVNKISDSAFKDCTSLNDVTFASGSCLSEIGKYAFYNCESLINLVIPESVTQIGAYAFGGCTAVRTLKFPESLKILKEYSFSNCQSLTEIILPDEIERVGYGAFQNCNYLSSFTAPFVGESANNNPYFAYVFGNERRRSYYVPETLKTVTITSAESLAETAFFECNNIEQINLPDCLKIIYRYAFSGCSSLSDLTIPEGVESLGLGVFENCSGLESLTVPFVGQSYSSNAFMAYSFGYESRDTSNALPQSLKSITVTNAETIGDYAFYGDEFLTEINLPNGLLSIGDFAFYQCKRISEIILPSTLTSIGESAFSRCDNLVEITFEGTSLRSIGNSAFYRCEKINSVEFPEGLLSIGNNAFNYCMDLRSVTLPETLNRIGADAFNNCYNLFEVFNVSSLILEKGSDANGCVSRYALFVYDSADALSRVKVKDDFVFILTDEGVSLVGYLYYGYFNNGLFTLPESVGFNGTTYSSYSIGSNVFRGEIVESIVIPLSVNAIADDAFTVLTVYYRGTQEEWEVLTEGTILFQDSDVRFSSNGV